MGNGSGINDESSGRVFVLLPATYSQGQSHSFSKPFSRTIVTADAIKEALKQVKYPGFSRDIVSFGLVRSATFADGTAQVALAITTSDPKVPTMLKAEIEKCLRAQPGVKDVIIELAVSAAKAPPQPGQSSPGGGTAPKGLKHSVAIASGKGGVGKSTFAVNLACALAQLLEARGRPGRVGLMDCDIYGPSVPLMMGLQGRPAIEGRLARAARALRREGDVHGFPRGRQHPCRLARADDHENHPAIRPKRGLGRAGCAAG
jgi:metal-sulfur cluster biosynthetic enzyme